MSRNVLCLKWGNKYSAEYVNVLYSMVVRNTTHPVRFYCMTDDPTGIREEVIIKPLLMENNTQGWWHKLSFFANPLHDIQGPVLSLDLDLVIVDNIDCFFEHSGQFCIERDIYPQNGFNSSVMKFEAGQHSDIASEWKCEWAGKHLPSGEKMWGDQAWITHKRPNATPWPNDWIRSYKWECCDKKMTTFSVPEGCKIIMFHGKPDPHEQLQHVGKWWRV